MKLFITLLFLSFAGYAQSAKDLCSQLTGDGSGKDAKARTAIMKLTHTAAREDGSARKEHEAILLSCLQKSTSSEVSTFLIQQLDICGAKESLPHLAKLLNDPEIGPNAARTFTNLAPYDETLSRELILTAYKKQPAPYLLNAISILKISDSATLSIYRDALSKKDFQPFALQGLAQTGDVKDSDLFINTFQKADKVFRGRAFRLNLVFTKALGSKNKSSAVSHLAKLKSSISKNEIPYITGIASVDFEINGVSDTWLDSLPKENVHTQTGIIRVLKAKQYPGVADKLAKLAAANQNEPVYLEALAEIDPSKASASVLNALKSQNKEMRSTASKLAANYGGEFATSMLSALIAKGEATKEDTALAKSMVSPKNINDVVALWKDLNPSLTLAFIEVTGAIQNNNVAAKMIASSKSTDKKVQKEALKALKDVVSSENLSELENMLNSEKNSSSVRYLQLAAAAAIAQSSEETLKGLFSKLYNARNDNLLIAFAKSNRKEVLPLLKRDLQNESLEVQKETIKTLSGMTPELSADLLATAVEKAKDERNKILAARALAEAALNSKEDKKTRKSYIERALKQTLPETEKKLLTERLKQIK